MGQGGHEKPEKSPMRTEVSTYHQVRRIRGVPGQRSKAVDMGWGDRSRTSNTSIDTDIEPAEYVIGSVPYTKLRHAYWMLKKPSPYDRDVMRGNEYT